MVGVQSIVEGMVRTFGPFLIPVTVFAIGVVGYTVLYLVSRQFRSDEEASVVNLSAGTPERSATDNDHGASTRGVLPYGDDDGTATEDTETDGSGATDVDDGGDDRAADRTEDTSRHND